MIQRIQSVYLLLITVLAVVALCMPMGRFLQDGVLTAELYNLYLMPANGEAVYAPWALFALLLLVAISSFGCIFLFKKRMLQVRIIIFNALLLVGYYIAYGVFVYILGKTVLPVNISHVIWNTAKNHIAVDNLIAGKFNTA